MILFKSTALLALAAFATAQTEPGMYSRDGNLNIEVGAGKSILLKQGDQDEVDLLAQLASLEADLASYEDGFSDAVNEAINRREVTTTVVVDVDQEANAKAWLLLGKFDVSQVAHIMLSAKGCGLGYGMSIDVVGAFGIDTNDNVSPEAFFLGAGDKQNGGNFDMFFKATSDTQYFLYLKYNAESNQFCAQNAKDNGQSTYEFEFTAGVTLSTPFVNDDGAPTINNIAQFNAQLKPVIKLSLEDLQAKIDSFNINVISGSYFSNMEGGDTTVKRVESDDESGRAMGQYKQGDGVFFLGLFDGAQTLHIDFEDKGCKRSVGMSYTIVARRGLDNENDPAVPEAFFFGAGNAWASDGIQFRYKKHAETGKSNNLYWLWLHLPQQPGGDNGCGNPESNHDVSIKVTTSSKQLETDLEMLESSGGFKETDFGSKIMTMPQRSLKEISDKIETMNKFLEVTWDANKGEGKSNDPDTDDLALGLFHVRQVVEVVAELNGCRQTFGMHTNVVARSGIYTADSANAGNWLGAPTSFMYGSAAQSDTTNVDHVHLYWQPLNGEMYWLWMKIDGPASQCKDFTNDDDDFVDSKPHSARISTKISSKQLEQTDTTGAQPRFDACRRQPDGSYDKGDQNCAKQIERVSIQDVAAMTTPGSPEMNAVVQAALNQRTFLPVKYANNYPDDDAAMGEKLMYIGTFNAWEVVHLDVSDTGCMSTTGIFFNIVARWGLDGNECTDTLDPESERCAPEAFMFGTANDVAAGNIKPYWFPIPGKQTLYELYIGVSNFAQCGTKPSTEHTLYASVRSSGPLRGDYNAVTGEWVDTGSVDGNPLGCSASMGKDSGQIADCVGRNLAGITVLSIEDAANSVAAMTPSEYTLMDTFDAKGAGTDPNVPSGMTVVVTDYGSQNKKVLNIKYTANDAEQADKDNEWAIQVPLGLMKTFQPLHITVQDIGASSGIGHSYTCVAKQQASSTNAQKNWYPECFYFGSAASVRDDRNNNFNFYFMAGKNADFPQGRADLKDYVLYLGVSEFNAARTGAAGHTMTIEISSVSAIRWCLPGDDAYKANGAGCDAFSLTDATNFWTKTASRSILENTVIFPTEQMVNDDPSKGSTGGQGGLVKPFISLEDVNTKVDLVVKNAKACFNSGKLLNPDTGKCCTSKTECP